MNTKEQHLTDEALWVFVDTGTITREDQLHLKECKHCASQLESFRSFTAVLTATQAEPSIAFTSKVLAARKEKLPFPWFVATTITVFGLIFAMSLYLVEGSGIALSSNAFKVLSFIAVISFLLLIQVRMTKIKIPNH